MHLLVSVTFLAVVSLLTITPTQAANKLCDTCECSYSQGVVKFIACECSTTEKELNITQQSMSGLAHIETFSVANCFSVNFHQNSFAESHDLAEVSVRRVGQVTLPVGVFSTLRTLLLEDVTDLRLHDKAFIGADNIHNITIHRCNISVLPSHALYKIKGLKLIELKDVRIDVIKAQAMDITMVPGSSFVVDSCEVGNIEANAITLSTGSLHITNSHVQNVTANAVFVSAIERIDIGTTFFGAGCSDSGILLESKDIRIINNTFHILPIGLLDSTNDGESILVFQENNIYEFTLGLLNDLSHLDNFLNNKVICNCHLASAIPTFIALNKINTNHIIENNFCYLESKCKISLQTFSDNRQCNDDYADDDEEVLESICANQPSTTTKDLPTPTVTQRTTTTTSTTQQSTHPQNTVQKTTATSSQHIGSTGKINLVDGVLIAFILITSAVKYI